MQGLVAAGLPVVGLWYFPAIFTTDARAAQKQTCFCGSKNAESQESFLSARSYKWQQKIFRKNGKIIKEGGKNGYVLISKGFSHSPKFNLDLSVHASSNFHLPRARCCRIFVRNRSERRVLKCDIVYKLFRCDVEVPVTFLDFSHQTKTQVNSINACGRYTTFAYCTHPLNWKNIP